MEQIYNFGISQDDALTEYKALKINTNDRLLCVASAGEIPLNLLTMQNFRIDAVDISINQIYLTRLKLYAVRQLEPLDAAAFIGFMETTRQKRLQLFQKVSELMENQEKLFWQQNMNTILIGAIHAARFEKYISRFNWLGLLIIGKKRLLKLFEFDQILEQQKFFDRYLSNYLLKMIFKIAFHPRIYKQRGIAAEGLKHSGERNIAQFFYVRFRDFCCATLARHNYYLQFTFFNKVLFPEALPEYLTEEGVEQIRKNYSQLTIRHLSYQQALEQSIKGEFNKFALSNIGDWMEKSEFTKLLELIQDKADSSSLILSRYIHYNQQITGELANYFQSDYDLGKNLVVMDRYPFYSVVPIEFNVSGLGNK